MRNPVTRQMMANHLENTKIKNIKYKVCIEMPNEFGCKIPFKAGEGIPLEFNPPMGGELAEETLDLAPEENQRLFTEFPNMNKDL